MKYKTKSVLISNQIQYLKVNKKNIQNNNAINSGKIDENNLKFTNNRQFGNDLTISMKNGKQVQNQKLSSNNITQNQNKTQVYIKKLSPSSQIIQKVNKQRLKINNTKKSSSIYSNKTNLVLDKRKSSLINNKIITNYASKPNQYNYNGSMIKHKFNTKKNNSVCFVAGYQNKDNSINYKNNGNTSISNAELNTSNMELLSRVKSIILKDSLKNCLTNRETENPFRSNFNNSIYNFRAGKNLNRSIEKKKNFITQMSFRIEKSCEKRINCRKANENTINEITIVKIKKIFKMILI